MFTVTPPSPLVGVTVLGSPLNVTIRAGPADVSHSSINVSVPPTAYLGTRVWVHITLADVDGNAITAPAEGEYDDSRLAIAGEHNCGSVITCIAHQVPNISQHQA
jgi:hypothetical protein